MSALPLVTAELPGSAGIIKVTPDDFRVDEIPAYAPAGAGAHLYLHVEKTGRTTRDGAESACLRPARSSP